MGIVCSQGGSCWEPQQSKLNTTQIYTDSEVRYFLTRDCPASPELGKVAFSSQGCYLSKSQLPTLLPRPKHPLVLLEFGRRGDKGIKFLGSVTPSWDDPCHPQGMSPRPEGLAG